MWLFTHQTLEKAGVVWEASVVDVNLDSCDPEQHTGNQNTYF
jgi:hypothetical protein